MDRDRNHDRDRGYRPDGEVRRLGAGESYRPYNSGAPRGRSPRRGRSPVRDRERDTYIPNRSPRRRSRSFDRFRGRDSRDGPRDGRDVRDGRDGRDNRDNRDGRDGRDGPRDVRGGSPGWRGRPHAGGRSSPRRAPTSHRASPGRSDARRFDYPPSRREETWGSRRRSPSPFDRDRYRNTSRGRLSPPVRDHRERSRSRSRSRDRRGDRQAVRPRDGSPRRGYAKPRTRSQSPARASDSRGKSEASRQGPTRTGANMTELRSSRIPPQVPAAAKSPPRGPSALHASTDAQKQSGPQATKGQTSQTTSRESTAAPVLRELVRRPASREQVLGSGSREPASALGSREPSVGPVSREASAGPAHHGPGVPAGLPAGPRGYAPARTTSYNNPRGGGGGGRFAAPPRGTPGTGSNSAPTGPRAFSNDSGRPFHPHHGSQYPQNARLTRQEIRLERAKGEINAQKAKIVPTGKIAYHLVGETDGISPDYLPGYCQATMQKAKHYVTLSAMNAKKRTALRDFDRLKCKLKTVQLQVDLAQTAHDKLLGLVDEDLRL